MATFKGTTGKDTLHGTSAADILYGLAGDDSLYGLGGNDLLIGAAGNDLLDGGTGNDIMRGGSGNDIYVINSTGDKIDEQGSNDLADRVRSTISVNLSTLGAGAIENATLLGTAGLSATGNAKNNVLTGNTGDNQLSGGSGNDRLDGGSGNDKLLGGNGNDRLLGSAGNDTISGGAGNDRIDSGSGNDTIRHSGTGADGDDVLLNFSGGNDTIVFTGHDFYDVNWERDGSDLILGAVADSTYTFDGTVRVVGFFYSENNLTVKIDTRFNEDYGTNASIATIHFTANVEKGINNTSDTEILVGYYDSNDVINGNGGFYDGIFGLGGDDILNGGDGFDYIRGGAGDDQLNGDAGDDLLRGERGADNYDGGAGIDVLRFFGGASVDNGVIVDLSTNTVTNDGFGNVETVVNVENVRGSNFDDKITGDDNDNVLRAEGGKDTLDAGAGSDILDGGGGDDAIKGGSGADLFRITSDNGLDTIGDFSVADGDVLDFDFSELAGLGIAEGDLSSFILLDDSGANTLVSRDVDGGGIDPATQVATLTGVASANSVVVRLDGVDFAFNSGTGEFEAVV